MVWARWMDRQTLHTHLHLRFGKEPAWVSRGASYEPCRIRMYAIAPVNKTYEVSIHLENTQYTSKQDLSRGLDVMCHLPFL